VTNNKTLIGSEKHTTLGRPCAANRSQRQPQVINRANHVFEYGSALLETKHKLSHEFALIKRLINA